MVIIRSLGSVIRRALVLSAPMLVVYGAASSGAVSAADAADEAAEEGAEIVVVGDSITADNIEVIGAHLAEAGTPPVTFEARAARRIADSYEWHGWRSSGLEAIDGVRGAGVQPALWVIELGTNDMFLVADLGWPEKVSRAGELIDDVVDAVGPDAPIAWVSVLHRDDPEVSRAFNEALRNRAVANPQMVVIDWQHAAVDHPEWFLDLVHPNSEGAGVLAELYSDAIERLLEPRPDPVAPTTTAGLSRR